MISLNDVSFKYKNGESFALRDVSLRVEEGDFLGIIGESGAGKTTLGHAINGLIPHHYEGDYYGEALVQGLDTLSVSLTDLSQLVGTVSQDIDSQMVSAVVEDELLFGLENFGVDPAQVEQRMVQALDEVGISSLRHRRIDTLSGGQKQKVAIAAILAMRPSIVLLDEPTGELDPVSSRQIFDVLRRLNQQGVTVVVIEQKVMLLCEYAKHVAVMAHGQVVLQGSVDHVLQNTDIMEQAGVNCPRVATFCKQLHQRGVGDGRVVADVQQAASYVAEVLADATADQEGGKRGGAFESPDAGSGSVGAFDLVRDALLSDEGDAVCPACASFGGLPAQLAVSFEEVRFGYQDHQVLQGLDLRIQEGEFVAILGPNGTGKSTTLRLMDGLLQPSTGTVRVCGLDASQVKTSQLARHVGFLFQNPDRQICQNTVRDEVLFGLRAVGAGSDQQQRDRAEQVLDLLHLNGDVDPFNLSRGQRQAVALAGLIALQPDVMLLDEPTTGFDYSECMEMMAHIKRLNSRGTTVVMVCHDMEVVLDFASRVVVLCEGRVLLDGAPRQVFQQRELLEKASLLPPQICQLSQDVGVRFPFLAGKFTAEELADAVAAAVGAFGKDGE